LHLDSGHLTQPQNEYLATFLKGWPPAGINLLPFFVLFVPPWLKRFFISFPGKAWKLNFLFTMKFMKGMKFRVEMFSFLHELHASW